MSGRLKGAVMTRTAFLQIANWTVMSHTLPLVINKGMQNFANSLHFCLAVTVYFLIVKASKKYK